jgi:hypothetical protein
VTFGTSITTSLGSISAFAVSTRADSIAGADGTGADWATTVAQPIDHASRMVLLNK